MFTLIAKVKMMWQFMFRVIMLEVTQLEQYQHVTRICKLHVSRLFTSSSSHLYYVKGEAPSLRRLLRALPGTPPGEASPFRRSAGGGAF
jgi:hypothetical protein